MRPHHTSTTISSPSIHLFTPASVELPEPTYDDLHRHDFLLSSLISECDGTGSVDLHVPTLPVSSALADASEDLILRNLNAWMAGAEELRALLQFLLQPQPQQTPPAPLILFALLARSVLYETEHLDSHARRWHPLVRAFLFPGIGPEVSDDYYGDDEVYGAFVCLAFSPSRPSRWAGCVPLQDLPGLCDRITALPSFSADC